ncbi:MAG: hypothetical protein DMG96_38655 [Acidobacteria bacterium]|nr:MAG: hypothetical protein DMG96_38655 [Acidobacteriota bacterium]
MLKLPSHVRLELKVIPQQRETPRRHGNKVIARRQPKRLRAPRHQETVKPGSQFFKKKFKKSIDTLSHS